jgi:esterase/lipase superfamily enzyme
MVLVAPATAQRPERMNRELVKQLRDAEIQRGLIASGALDAVVGRASRSELRAAIVLFRKTYRFKEGVEPLTDVERNKLREIYAQFVAATGLKDRITDPTTGLKFLLPEKLVSKDAQRSLHSDKHWAEYRAEQGALSIGPEKIPLSDETPISLFRARIMGTRGQLTYKQLHLTSEEFTALAEVAVPQPEKPGEDFLFFSYNQILTDGDQLKGLWMRYNILPPDWFKVSDFDFLLPMVEAETAESNTSKPDPKERAWRLLMQGVTNLIASEFPFANGWERVSTKDCQLSSEMHDEASTIRILFGTDRKIMLPRGRQPGRVTDPDTLFSNEPGGMLHLGCAYVSKSAAKSEKWSDLVQDYKLVRESKTKGDIGDQLYMTDEIGEGRERADALVFIHGYNVPLKYALSTVARVVAETGYKGRVYVYSWPSAESTFGYIRDLDSAEQAEPFFQSFMRMLMRDANIREIDVLAHSMGSQTLLRAVSALRSIFETDRGGRKFGEQNEEGMRARSIRIGQMIFAAPDVARSVFDQKIARIAPYADRVTVYVSSTDAALSLSGFLRSGAPRMGELSGGEPALIDNSKVHIIDATGNRPWYQTLFRGYGHDYFSQAESVLRDIEAILKARGKKDTTFPHERSDRFKKIEYKEAKGKYFWQLKEK